MERFSVVLFICFLVSCNSSPEPKKYIDKTSIQNFGNYKILHANSDWAIGDNTDQYYELVVSKEDYNTIVKDIESKWYFKRMDTSKVPLYVLDKTDYGNEVACKYDNKYFYQVLILNPRELVTVVLEKDSLVKISSVMLSPD